MYAGIVLYPWCALPHPVCIYQPGEIVLAILLVLLYTVTPACMGGSAAKNIEFLSQIFRA